MYWLQQRGKQAPSRMHPRRSRACVTCTAGPLPRRLPQNPLRWAHDRFFLLCPHRKPRRHPRAGQGPRGEARSTPHGQAPPTPVLPAHPDDHHQEGARRCSFSPVKRRPGLRGPGWLASSLTHATAAGCFATLMDGETARSGYALRRLRRCQSLAAATGERRRPGRSPLRPRARDLPRAAVASIFATPRRVAKAPGRLRGTSSALPADASWAIASRRCAPCPGTWTTGRRRNHAVRGPAHPPAANST